jgi:hypothetical protein
LTRRLFLAIAGVLYMSLGNVNHCHLRENLTVGHFSNLLRAMAKTTEKTLPKDSQMREPVDLVLSIGELTFDQLSTLRHRGAFSTVSLTFTRCCQITQVEGTLRSSLDSHLLDWYQVFPPSFPYLNGHRLPLASGGLSRFYLLLDMH